MQKIQEWPLFIKICFGTVFTALVVAGLVEIPNYPEQGEEDSSQNLNSLVNVEIIVVSDTNEPLENVEVRFVSKGSPEVRRTNTDGFAQIQIPSRDDIEITLSKDEFRTARHNLNLNNDSGRTRTYYMQPQ